MKKILIFDDDKSIQMLYTDELMGNGFDVISIGDGSRVMKLIKKENHDVIVMDIKLDKDKPGTFYYPFLYEKLTN